MTSGRGLEAERGRSHTWPRCPNFANLRAVRQCRHVWDSLGNRLRQRLDRAARCGQKGPAPKVLARIHMYALRQRAPFLAVWQRWNAMVHSLARNRALQAIEVFQSAWPLHEPSLGGGFLYLDMLRRRAPPIQGSIACLIEKPQSTSDPGRGLLIAMLPVLGWINCNSIVGGETRASLTSCVFARRRKV